MQNLDENQIEELRSMLQSRLASLLDLSLTLKHVHWNVVGPNFISVHEMLDDFVARVRPMSDAVAERIRTLDGVPVGTPQAVVDTRDWKDYPIAQADSMDHLEALHSVFGGIIDDHREVMAFAADADPVTEDLLIGQTADLELMQWFVRSFLEKSGQRGTFGFADREPTDAERTAADKAEMGEGTSEHYREMAEIGADAKGEGKITG